jgi:hypothetical protein
MEVMRSWNVMNEGFVGCYDERASKYVWYDCGGVSLIARRNEQDSTMLAMAYMNVWMCFDVIFILEERC